MAHNGAVTAATPSSPGSQTLSRGIRALEILAESPAPLMIGDLAERLGVHRSVAYRIVRTLEDHSLISRDDAGRLAPGLGLAALARGVSRDLQATALPVLTALTEDLVMTTFIAVLDRTEVVTLLSVEPRHAVATVAQRPGTRHPLSEGAPGHAIQASLSATEHTLLAGGIPRAAGVDAVISSGYATSHDEVIAGLSSIAVPLRIPGSAPAALAVVFAGTPLGDEQIAERLSAAARAIRVAFP
ncbi:IclR family transcriptional regulator [Mycetocola spongiae]|uniref:IclR family transcriptional regulator n=1 Tax=Mycetocola spongiae TaxID=2859226 RepID=UPI001CF263D7|nr:helix-turn-helix domain-containing protein [Mycetocola spongiae]UCR88716.1 helix-turn-helix domain-containing protein [Mycetocola spongiae]